MPIKVFIADDHAIVLDGLSVLLEEEEDIKVVGVASDGSEAVRKIKKLNPDVVLMDITMPLLNGIEATHQILETLSSTRVIILSMHSSKEHIFRALQAGAKGYLLKESAGQKVVKAVRAVHAGNRYFSEFVTETMIDDYIHQRKTAWIESPMERLSTREKEILQLVVEGKTSVEIADALYLSPKTVETYRSRLMQKLEVSDLPSLVKFAIRHGVTTVDN